MKANGREPKTGVGRVFNIELGCFDDVSVLIYADARPHLRLKTRPRSSPFSLSLSMLQTMEGLSFCLFGTEYKIFHICEKMNIKLN
jgi:hypothetical protein